MAWGTWSTMIEESKRRNKRRSLNEGGNSNSISEITTGTRNTDYGSTSSSRDRDSMAENQPLYPGQDATAVRMSGPAVNMQPWQQQGGNYNWGQPGAGGWTQAGADAWSQAGGLAMGGAGDMGLQQQRRLPVSNNSSNNANRKKAKGSSSKSCVIMAVCCCCIVVALVVGLVTWNWKAIRY